MPCFWRPWAAHQGFDSASLELIGGSTLHGLTLDMITFVVGPPLGGDLDFIAAQAWKSLLISTAPGIFDELAILAESISHLI